MFMCILSFILVIISCVVLHVLHLLVVSRILPTSLGVGALSSLIEPRATIHYPLLVINLKNHALHYTRLDCFAGWRLRRLLLFIFLLQHRPSPQHVYTYTYQLFLEGRRGGVDGRIGYRV